MEQPENFSFPASLANLTRSGSWVFNGKTLWKDGVKQSHEYGSRLLDSLPEGSSVGLLRRGSSLHLLINDTDQGIAEHNLPAGDVYALVDVYGRCSKVSIVSSDSSEEAYGADSVTLSNRGHNTGVCDELLFYERCGRLVQVKRNGREAYRTRQVGQKKMLKS